VTIVGRDGTRVHHPRKRFGQRSIDYRHYLAELARKLQAGAPRAPGPPPASRRPISGDLGSAPRGAWATRGRAALRQGVGQLDTQGATVVIPALTAALALGVEATRQKRLVTTRQELSHAQAPHPQRCYRRRRRRCRPRFLELTAAATTGHDVVSLVGFESKSGL
jgi:hypothetical protein